MKPIDKVLSKLDKVQGKHPQYSAKCPAHEDRGPSLRIRETDDGRVLINCRAGCASADVLAAIGLSLGELYPQAVKSHVPPANHQQHSRLLRRIEMLEKEVKRLRDVEHELSEENIRLKNARTA